MLWGSKEEKCAAAVLADSGSCVSVASGLYGSMQECGIRHLFPFLGPRLRGFQFVSHLCHKFRSLKWKI